MGVQLHKFASACMLYVKRRDDSKASLPAASDWQPGAKLPDQCWVLLGVLLVCHGCWCWLLLHRGIREREGFSAEPLGLQTSQAVSQH